MHPIAKNTLAAIVGFLAGNVVNIALVNIGQAVVPLLEGPTFPAWKASARA